MATRRNWPAPPPLARVGLLVLAGVLLTGVALWAGSVGPWVGRPVSTESPELPTITPPTFTVPTLPTYTPPPVDTGGSTFNLGIVLWVLAALLVVALLLMLAAYLRGRGEAGTSSKRRRTVEPDGPIPALPQPDPDRPFDTREAADYVIACWDQVEQRAAARSAGRRPEQTPTEFMEALLAGYPVDNSAAAELLGLYQRARFDHVRLLPDTAVRARTCADAVLVALAPVWSGA